MTERSDAWHELAEIFESPDYWWVMGTEVVITTDRGDEFEFSLDDVDDVRFEGYGEQRGVIERGVVQVCVAFDDFSVHGFHVWHIDAGSIMSGIVSAEKEVPARV